MSFQNAKIKRFDARIQAVAHDVIEKYGMYFVMLSPESPTFRAPEIVRGNPPIELLQCGFDVTDGPQIPKNNRVVKPSRSVQDAHFSEETNCTCECRNPRQAMSKVTLHRQNAVID